MKFQFHNARQVNLLEWILKYFSYIVLQVEKTRAWSRNQQSRVSTMPKTKLLNVRISPELKKKAKKLAEQDGRSLSNWVTRLITREVKKAEKSDSSKGWGGN